MCLLIHKPADAEMSPDLIMDVYSRNKDGFGVMYMDGGELKVVKTLAGPDQIIPLYQEHCEGRECVIHFRMQTHGDINLDNCHPYEVTKKIWMAHNGILSCGNPFDSKKSDTWHFIVMVLSPHLEQDPSLLHDERFQEFIGDMIGSGNKFGFMNDDGEVVIINRSSGVDHMGMWFSNTYAWNPAKFGYHKSAVTNYYGGYSFRDKYNVTGNLSKQDTDYDFWPDSEAFVLDEAFDEEKETKPKSRKLNWNKVYRAAYNCWRRGDSSLRDWVYATPEKAALFLQRTYEITEPEAEEMVNSEPDEVATWISDILHECERYATEPTKVMSYYSDAS